jgi:penicillin-binding protein 1C
MNWLHNDYPSMKPDPPAGVVQRKVEISGLNQTKSEWFIKGTESEIVRDAGKMVTPKISYPTDGTIIMIDPDIPVQNQLMFFEAAPAAHSLHWILNDERIGDADAIKTWAPVKGKYVLRLMDGDKKIDSISFEVRGN